MGHYACANLPWLECTRVRPHSVRWQTQLVVRLPSDGGRGAHLLHLRLGASYALDEKYGNMKYEIHSVPNDALNAFQFKQNAIKIKFGIHQ